MHGVETGGGSRTATLTFIVFLLMKTADGDATDSMDNSVSNPDSFLPRPIDQRRPAEPSQAGSILVARSIIFWHWIVRSTRRARS